MQIESSTDLLLGGTTAFETPLFVGAIGCGERGGGTRKRAGEWCRVEGTSRDQGSDRYKSPLQSLGAFRNRIENTLHSPARRPRAPLQRASHSLRIPPSFSAAERHEYPPELRGRFILARRLIIILFLRCTKYTRLYRDRPSRRPCQHIPARPAIFPPPLAHRHDPDPAEHNTFPAFSRRPVPHPPMHDA